MGIKGLHKALAFCTVKDNLNNYRGQRLAVDTSSWLHKSVYSFSEKFVETTDRGQIDPECVRRASNYLHKRCQEILVQHKVAKIFLVMDGKRCPLKADESQDRENKRRQNLEEARKYKRQGQRHVAEEKYKGCIRIKSDFTKAVMNVFRKHLAGENRVIIVQAPYEADAQLIKLCIDQQADAVVTEDSDVLVYSAAAHVAFPVLFKLDRNSGNCQMISMDFLLSMSSEDTEKAIRTSNKLEGYIRNLGSRQHRRKGFGVRLFVQACVLSGCDYSFNTIDGVGLVNAFKLVRDNAFRNDNKRFQHILKSLPNKVKKKLDIDEYEDRLAKSEAVFFYHLVSHLGGDVKPLLVPRISAEENPKEHDHTNHFPFMERFKEDWSFLGVPGVAKQGASMSAIDTNVARLPQGGKAVGTKSKFFVKPTTAKRPATGPINNPYKRTKLFADAKRAPLEEQNGNKRSSSKPSAIEAPREQSQNELDMIKYLKEIPDPRYVKRKFPSRKPSKSTKVAPSSSDDLPTLNPTHQKGHPRANRQHANMFARFQYDTTASVQNDMNNSKPQSSRHFASSTESHAVEPGIDALMPREGPPQQPPSASSDTSPTGSSPKTSQNFEIDLTGSDDEQQGVNTPAAEQPMASQSSRFFRKTSNDPRRVSLEDSDEPLIVQESNSPPIQPTGNSTSAIANDWDSDDDAIESPAKQPSTFHSKNPYNMGLGVPSDRAISQSRQPKNKAKASGPLLAGFQRQQEFFGHMKQSSQKFHTYSSARKGPTMKSLASYFKSPEKEEVSTKPQFSQLALNTNQTDEGLSLGRMS